MRVIDVLNSPWAIIPERLAEITEIYSTHLRGEKIDFKAVEAQLGRPLVHEQKPYAVVDGVALLYVEGVLSKKMNLFTEFSGGTSTQILARDFKRAVADSDVQAIVLIVDSPGGTVDGTQELAHLVMAARDAKPIVAFADGLMASAAYYIGSAADAVYISSDSTQVGSIGVAMQHVDYSKRGEMLGVKVTDIYAGKYKRMASQHAALTQEARDYLQSQVDHLYSVFVEDVAKQRGVPVDTVLKDMADGRIFIGQQAISAGLVDGASTLDALIAELSSGTYKRLRGAAAGDAAEARAGEASPEAQDADGAGAAPSVEPQPNQEDAMDLKTLKEKYPEVAKAAAAEGFAAGSEAERTRILAVFDQAMPGHEKLIRSLAFDGKTTGPEAAVQILAAERAKLGRRAEDIAADAADVGKAPAPTPAADPGAGKAPDPAAEDKPLEERAKAKWDADAKLRAEFSGDFKAFLALERAQEAGRVRVLGKKSA